MITQEEQNREYLEQYNKARETMNYEEQAKELKNQISKIIYNAERNGNEMSTEMIMELIAKQTQPEIKVDENIEQQIFDIFEESFNGVAHRKASAKKIAVLFESMNKKIETVLKMCNDNEKMSDFAVSTESVRAILTKDRL